MKPLAGMRILDLTRVVSGPFCTMALGDLGAEVIKIEEPGAGDDSRAFGPPFVEGESAYFLSVNRNKQSCCIDLKKPEGRRLLLELAKVSDVLVENFRPGTMERLGLGDEVLTSINPRLVRCSVTGFGTSGPDAQRPGYDLIVQGESGIMDITGEPGGPPTKIGTSVADLVTGLYAVQGIVSALLERERSGHAARVDVAMLDAMASLLTFNAGMFFATGRSPTRRGNAHPTIFPYETFRASDGWINLGVANDKFWQLFCDAIEAPQLAGDARFATAPLRVANRAELAPLLEPILAAKPRAHWMEVLRHAGVPCGQISTVGEVCEAPQLTSRGMVLGLPHPSAGTVYSIAEPVRFDDRAPYGHVAPPRHGEHTEAVLGAVLGLSPERVRELVAAGVVGARSSPAGSQRND